jgi:hypothetical protein
VDDYLGKNHYQLPNLGNGIQRSGWEEGCSKSMSTGAPRTVSAKRMERIFRHGEVAYDTECLITTQKDS